EGQALAGAGATLVGQGFQGPGIILPTLIASHHLGVVRLPEMAVAFEPDRPKPVEKAEPLLAHMIQGVQDDKPLPSRWNENEDEQRSYSIVLFEASRISADAFRKGARKDITYVHLFNDPAKYRGQVVHVEATL